MLSLFTRDATPFKTRIVKYIQVALYKISLPFLDLLILLNKDDKNDLLDKYHIKVKKLEILGGIGVDLDKFRYSAAPTKPVSFVFVGRLLAEKGIFEYLQAAKIVKSQFPETEFYVFGDFDEKNPFALKREDLAEYLHDGVVIYEGFVHDIHERLKRISVFVLPSYYREGVPRSIQEAMAIGRPIITTDSVGCRETVEDGVNGFLVPPYDAEALAEKMRFFVENPKLITAMGHESRKIAEKKFDINRINKQIIKYIH